MEMVSKKKKLKNESKILKSVISSLWYALLSFWVLVNRFSKKLTDGVSFLGLFFLFREINWFFKDNTWHEHWCSQYSLHVENWMNGQNLRNYQRFKVEDSERLLQLMIKAPGRDRLNLIHTKNELILCFTLNHRIVFSWLLNEVNTHSVPFFSFFTFHCWTLQSCSFHSCAWKSNSTYYTRY